MEDADLKHYIEALERESGALAPFIKKMYEPASKLDQYDKIMLREHIIMVTAYVKLLREEFDRTLNNKKSFRERLLELKN